MKQHILFLTYRMRLGFGVDVVVANLYRHLGSLGTDVTVGCIEKDKTYQGIDIIKLPADVDKIVVKAQSLGVTHIVAHASPFFEILPQINNFIPSWCFEHGDPTPSFFPKDEQKLREAVKKFKQEHCYPYVQGVIAISEFIKHDILGPLNHTEQIENITVIHNGCDHMPDMGSKPFEMITQRKQDKLKIGCLMRMGKGESYYKSSQLFIDLFDQLKTANIPIEFHVMGRGSRKSVKKLVKKGMTAHLNASEKEKIEYLRGLDIFVSLSLWEGFNLPLVEAQALGTVGLALDTGAHPEVTPYVMSSLAQITSFIKACCQDPMLLHNASKRSYSFVRHHFLWEISALKLQKTLLHEPAGIQNPTYIPAMAWPSVGLIQKFKIHFKQYGLLSTIKITIQFLIQRIR